MEEMTFESAILALDEIIKKLENGNAPLEECLAEYEKAIALVRYCSEKLATAEKKITALTGEEFQ
ncbi:MAG: exodeoxyribonuclease VII small subunit [Clostridia bacterium]|nr:exodeoxyribonuclease VII small subunit [Clostridia bacterium]